ncbi:MAG: DUF6909 family protein [Desulfococcaceae bacterium]
MRDLTRSQKARLAIQSFKTIAHAVALRGYYRPSEKMGQSLADCLVNLSPEIYGSMTDPRVMELKGLEYVVDRLPRGIEQCNRIILTEESQFGAGRFEKLVPLRRRRTCYRISEREICFAITRGLSEIYDILTHLTFLYIEAGKIHNRMKDESGAYTAEWLDLERLVENGGTPDPDHLDQAIWNLSLILGRPYQETRAAHESMDRNRREFNGNNGIFSIIYHLGKRYEGERADQRRALVIYLTPSLMNIIGHQQYGEQWAMDIKDRLRELNLADRPLHIVSANLHSVLNLVYGYAAFGSGMDGPPELYRFIESIRDRTEEVAAFAKDRGFIPLPDRSGTQIDCQIIDTAALGDLDFHPSLAVSPPGLDDDAPVILVMDYAFGMQAFEAMENLLSPQSEDPVVPMKVRSISVMGKAGILPGKKGDVMLATAHIIEGSSDNYRLENDLEPEDFESDASVFKGPMVTVPGTSLQNQDLLRKFQESWRTVGLEMEGGHYQRAISAAIIKGHVPADTRVRYAYYASDNPLLSGETLAAGPMGTEGIRPTYMITKVILEKILAGEKGSDS